MRGTFASDKQGRYAFRGVKGAPYPVPNDGVCGDVLNGEKKLCVIPVICLQI